MKNLANSMKERADKPVYEHNCAYNMNFTWKKAVVHLNFKFINMYSLYMNFMLDFLSQISYDFLFNLDFTNQTMWS